MRKVSRLYGVLKARSRYHAGVVGEESVTIRGKRPILADPRAGAPSGFNNDFPHNREKGMA
jgi:hypothetical protein